MNYEMLIISRKLLATSRRTLSYRLPAIAKLGTYTSILTPCSFNGGSLLINYTLYLASSQAQQSGAEREVSSQTRRVSCPSSANHRDSFSYTIALQTSTRWNLKSMSVTTECMKRNRYTIR